MLVQDYLRSGKTLTDLETEYGIKSRINNTLKVVCLNYDMISSPMAEPIVQECRQLVLELDTWNLVGKSFNKFFNYGEGRAAEIDWSTAKIQEKLDGSIIMLYYRNGAWQVCTKSVPDGNTNVGQSNITFRDLVELTVRDMGFKDIEDFCKDFATNRSYIFELTSPENRVIVQYWDRKLTHLAQFANERYHEPSVTTGAEFSLDHPAHRVQFWKLDDRYKVVQTYPINVGSASELAELAGKLNPFENEGYVVVDANFNRVKVKNPLYITASNLVPNLVTNKQRIELCLADNFDDIIGLLPEDIGDGIKEFQKTFQEMLSDISNVYTSHKDIPIQKDFAISISGYYFKGVLFELRKGKNISDIIKTIHIDNLVALYDKWYKEKK